MLIFLLWETLKTGHRVAVRNTDKGEAAITKSGKNLAD